MGNPEFTRNFWLEMTPHRVIAMPLVIGSILYFVYLVFGSNDAVSKSARILFYLIALLWGTRQAAAAVAGEVRQATWDAQRVSALGAWPMSWGKLFGATLFNWYGGLICLAVFVVLPHDVLSLPVRSGDALRLILATLAGQALALATSLAVLRKASDGDRLSTNLCHAVGFLAGLVLAWPNILVRWLSDVSRGGGSRHLATWYGYSADADGFKIFVVSVFLFWCLLAVYRSMRWALQHRTLPWGWAAFGIFAMVFSNGYLYEALAANGTSLGRWLVLPVFVAFAVVYLAYLTEQKNVVTLSAYFTNIRSLHPWRIGAEAPSWLVCLALAAVLVVVAVLVTGGEAWSEWSGYWGRRKFSYGSFAVFLLTMLLFVFRDIGFLLFLNLNPGRRRADAAGLFYLFLFYVVGTGITQALGLDWAMHFFAPVPTGHSALIVGPILLEVLCVFAFLWWRLRSDSPPLRAAGG